MGEEVKKCYNCVTSFMDDSIKIIDSPELIYLFQESGCLLLGWTATTLQGS
jgi:hypothetical protein